MHSPELSVLFILPHPVEGPSSRFRVYQYLPYLRANGVRCTVRPFLRSEDVFELYRPGHAARKIGLTLAGLAARGRDVLRAREHDIVFILREAFALGPPFVERMLARAAGRMIFDFDDAIYTRSLAYDNPIDRLRDWSKPARLMARADTVIAGSPYLADYARRHAAGLVEVLPTVVDHRQFVPRARRGDEGGITLGWIGTPRGSRYVADLMPVFRRLARRHANLRMVFIGCAPFETEGLPIEFRDWSLAREAEDIAGFDIGIMPLSDDEETRGKCGFKLIEYMSCAVAAIGSPVGVNRQIIEHGVSGLLADSEEEWEAAIERLIRDRAYRAAMQKAGRERAIRHYSLESAAPRLLRILRQTAAAPAHV